MNRMDYYPPRYLFRRDIINRKVAAGGNFLEIGPGKLDLSNLLLNKFDEGQGIDFSNDAKKNLRFLSDEKMKRYKLLIGDYLETKFMSDSFDSVVACEVLEHVSDEQKFLAKINKELKNGGELVLSVPSRMKYWSVHDETVGHLRRYEKEELTILLRDQGFNNVSIYSYGFPFVNIFRLLRLELAGFQKEEKDNLTQIEQTKESGTGDLPKVFKFAKVLVNPITFKPLTLISSLFDKFDLSDGYLVLAKKVEK